MKRVINDHEENGHLAVRSGRVEFMEAAVRSTLRLGDVMGHKSEARDTLRPDMDGATDGYHTHTRTRTHTERTKESREPGPRRKK